MRYDIYVYCNDCSKDHPMGVMVDIADGPATRETIGDFYQREPLPPVMAHVIKKRVLCPKTGKFFIPDDAMKIFLVP